VVLQPISISGIGTLNVSGGTLNVAGTDTYSGQTTVLDGILSLQNLNDAGTGVGSVTVSASSTLDGTGGTSGSVAVNSGGILDPGIGMGTGILDTGSVTLDSGSIVNFQVNSAAPGTGYDQLNVNGSVNISAGAVLNLWGTVGTQFGDQLILIQSTTGITGTFVNAPDGSQIAVNGETYIISYEGGATGDDVVLTDVTLPPVTGIDPLEVNTTGDDPVGAGQLSLRDAVNLAKALGGDQTITFDPSLFSTGPATINLSDGPIVLNDSSGLIAIDAEGAANSLTVDAATGANAFTVAQGTSVILDGLAVGGTINNSGTIILEDSSIDAGLVSEIDNNNNGGQVICEFNQDFTVSDLSIPQVTYYVADGATALVDSTLSSTSNILIGSGSTLNVDSGGSLDVDGNLTIGDGSTLNLNGGSVTVNGSLTVGSGSALNISGGTLTVAEGGTLSASGNALVNLSGGSVVVSGEMDNAGEIDASGGTLEGTGTINLGGVTEISDGGQFEDAGLLTQQGELAFEDGGAFTVAAGAEMNLQLGSILIANGAMFDDGGQIILNGGATNIGGGTFAIEPAAQLELTPYATVQITAGGVLNDDGILTVDAGASLENNGTLNINGGTFAVAGTVYNDCAIDAQTGVVTITGALIASLSSNAVFNNGTTVDSYGTLAITGGSTFTVSGANVILAGDMILDQGTATLASGLFELNTSSSVHLRNGGLFNIAGGTFSNQIILGVDSGGTLQTCVPFNPGLLDVNDLGVLSLASGGSLAGGQVAIKPGGTLLNAATLNLSDALSSGTLVLDQGSSVVLVQPELEKECACASHSGPRLN
jgi:hypothetical protein